MKLTKEDWKKLAESAEGTTDWDLLLAQPYFDHLPDEERKLIRDLGEQGLLAQAANLQGQLDIQKAWGQLEPHLAGHSASRRIMPWLRYAGILLLPLLTVLALYYLWTYPEKSHSPIRSGSPVGVNSHQQATLILADGRAVRLGEMYPWTASFQQSSERPLHVAALQYASENTAIYPLAMYNEIRVPRGAEYQLILADNSSIWLNSESRLRFPAHFRGMTNREVFLEEGEAYFEVSKTKDAQPFIVHVGAMNVEVLGTSFNLDRYGQQIKTTLVEGKVNLRDTRSNRSLQLQPNQQGKYDQDNGTLQKQNIDIETALAWKKGLMIFEGQPLEQVMEQIARWYDCTVHFEEEELRHIHFGGRLKRYEQIDTILSIIEKTGHIQIQRKNQVIYITSKEKSSLFGDLPTH